MQPSLGSVYFSIVFLTFLGITAEKTECYATLALSRQREGFRPVLGLTFDALDETNDRRFCC
jgi:hypothetical protein